MGEVLLGRRLALAKANCSGRELEPAPSLKQVIWEDYDRIPDGGLPSASVGIGQQRLGSSSGVMQTRLNAPSRLTREATVAWKCLTQASC